MTRRVYLLVPTRTVQRDDKLSSLKRLVESVKSTAQPENVAMCFGLDERPEDAPLFDYVRGLAKDPPFPIHVRHKNDNPSGHWKHLSLECPENADDVVMLCADDVFFPDQGWDDVVLRYTAQPGHNLYFCDDGFGWKDTFATHPFMRFDTARAIGGLATGLWARANDTWLWCMWHLFDKSRIIYMPDVRIKHAYLGENEHQVRGHKDDMAKFREVGGQEMTWRVDRLRSLTLDTPPPPAEFRRDYMKFHLVDDGHNGSHDMHGDGYKFEIEILGN